eukprot:TRINITY_DN5539_c0_g1_i1.p1 TRINITY_DN5539_c0_g1~~TRINITY_DN5539_c0_g1_i1.p1  ORF type:complete len:1123 (+),score=336.84 TRINITY_DN5539_c0_g1_i1:76-3369(+)
MAASPRSPGPSPEASADPLSLSASQGSPRARKRKSAVNLSLKVSGDPSPLAPVKHAASFRGRPPQSPRGGRAAEGQLLSPQHLASPAGSLRLSSSFNVPRAGSALVESSPRAAVRGSLSASMHLPGGAGSPRRLSAVEGAGSPRRLSAVPGSPRNAAPPGSPRLARRGSRRGSAQPTNRRMSRAPGSPGSPGSQKGRGFEADEEAPEPPEDPKEAAERLRKEQVRQHGARVLQTIAHAGMFLRAAGWRRRGAPLRMRMDPAKVEELWKTMEDVRSAGQAGGGGIRLALPSAADMQALPSHLRKTFGSLALETLRNHLYPRALLWLRRRRKKAMIRAAQSECPPMTVELLRAQAMFREWPRALLEELLPQMVVEAVEFHEMVMHESEPGTGIYFLMTGKFEILKRIRSGRGEPVTKNRHQQIVVLSPVTCVGEFSILTEEPRMASIRAVSFDGCVCQVLRKDVLLPYLRQLPASTLSTIVELAFAARNRTMQLQHPMSAQSMRAASPILMPCTAGVLDRMIMKLTPYCVPKGLTLCRGDQIADRMFFLRSGRCGVMKVLVRRLSSGMSRVTQRTEEAHVHTICAPDTVGAVAVLQGVNFGDTVQTLTTCDFWVLQKEAFDGAVRSDPSCAPPMLAAARQLRQRQLEQQQNLFRQAIYDIPLLKDVCSRQQMRELVNAFEAHLYKQLSMLCSIAEYADRVIVLYKGRVRVGTDSRWWPSEAAGFTCVVPHRWALSAVSLDVAECLEFPLVRYEAFLRKHKLLRDVVMWSTALMFPYAPESQRPEAAVAQELVAQLRTPPMYPRSDLRKIDWSEQGFSKERPRHCVRPKNQEDRELAAPLPAQPVPQRSPQRKSRRPTIAESLGRAGDLGTAPAQRQLVQKFRRQSAAAAALAEADDLAITKRLISGLDSALLKAPAPAPLALRDAKGRRRRPKPYDWLPAAEGATPTSMAVVVPESRQLQPGTPASPTRRGPSHAGCKLGTTQVWRLGGPSHSGLPRSVMLMTGHYPPKMPRGTLYPDAGVPCTSPYLSWTAASGRALPEPDAPLQLTGGPAERQRPRSAAAQQPPPRLRSPAPWTVSHWYSPPVSTPGSGRCGPAPDP